MWNIIKTETNRKGKTKDVFCFSSGNDWSYDYFDRSDYFINLLSFQ
jgi:hypothetical protein